MSAFFVSAEQEYDPDTLIPAELKPSEGYVICRSAQSDGSYNTTYLPGLDYSVCYSDTYVSVSGGYAGTSYSNPQVDISRDDSNYIIGTVSYFTDDPNVPAYAKKTTPINFDVYKNGTKDIYQCPPSGSPEHIIKVGDSQCAKPKFADCPAGYHSKAVSKALGSSECVPKECPPAGSGEALYTSPNLGSSFSGGGMYCNDGCAYSVSGANITSDKHATGTSQGAACGDKPYDNKKLADEGDSDKCSTASNGDVTILSCEAATPTNDPKDPLDNDDSKTGDEPTPDKPKENCPDGDTICNLKNLEIQMQNSAQQTIDNQNELHNKQVDVQTKNTQSIVDSIDGLDTSIYLQTKQDERLHTVTVSKFNELIGAVNGIETGGGGGSGNGNTSGLNDGTCVGEGCPDESLYNGECEGELCDLDIVAELEESDNSLIEWFEESVTIPNEFSSSFTNMTNFVSANFASFNGTCIPFTLEVSIQGRPKQITVSEHCEPYETYFKPLVEWLLYTLTAFTVFNMLAQVFRSFSRI